MGYVQMTLDDWLNIKNSLREDLQGVAQSFVRIGYKLRQIEQRKLYEQDGYKSLAEFATAEYGLSQSATSRFMAINAKYSIEGYGEQLRPEFAELGSSKLSEMLTLPDADLEMIKPEAPREAIRELKKFEKSKPQDDGVEWIEALVAVNKEAIREWYKIGLGAETLRDLIVPAGTRTFKSGRWFVLMYEAEIKVKKFPEAPTSMSWAELADRIYEVCEEGGGQEDDHSEQEAVRNEQEVDHGVSAEIGGLHPKTTVPTEETKERSTAQENPEVVEESEEPEADAVGVCATGKDSETVAEILPPPEEYAPAHMEAEKEPEIVEQEETEEPFGTRWDYMDSLGTEHQVALYMVRQHKARTISTLELMNVEYMETWLRGLVDEKGEPWATD